MVHMHAYDNKLFLNNTIDVDLITSQIKLKVTLWIFLYFM